MQVFVCCTNNPQLINISILCVDNKQWLDLWNVSNWDGTKTMPGLFICRDYVNLVPPNGRAAATAATNEADRQISTIALTEVFGG